MMFIGVAAAAVGVVKPPLDCISKSGASTPICPSSAGVNKADSDRLYPLINELLDCARDIGLGQWPLHLAFGVDAFIDLDAQMALDERRRLGPRQVIEPRHPQGADLEHVAEAFCRDQPGARA